MPTPTGGVPVILDGVCHRYGPLRVLADVGLGLLAGEHLAVTGPSGAGKSTLLALVGGLDGVQEGSIRVGGRDQMDATFFSAGKKLLRVVDDGAGMEPEDCRLALERHATSKIASIEDLFDFYRQLPNGDRQLVTLPSTAHSPGFAKNRHLLWHATRAFLGAPAPAAS